MPKPNQQWIKVKVASNRKQKLVLQQNKMWKSLSSTEEKTFLDYSRDGHA